MTTQTITTARCQVIQGEWQKAVANETARLSKDLWKTELDFSPESLKNVDAILLKLRRRKDAPPPKMIDGLGCYAGEVLVRHTDGHWIDGGDGRPMVKVPDFGTANPIGKCWKRFRNGDSDSVEALCRIVLVMSHPKQAEKPREGEPSQ
jgi:hypothetical protein